MGKIKYILNEVNPSDTWLFNNDGLWISRKKLRGRY